MQQLLVALPDLQPEAERGRKVMKEHCPDCNAAVKPWRFSIEGWTERTGVECTECKWFRDDKPNGGGK